MLPSAIAEAQAIGTCRVLAMSPSKHCFVENSNLQLKFERLSFVANEVRH